MSRISAKDIVCVIPCAGKGTRMQPLTYTRPKALLPVCNQPILGHILQAVAHAGIRRVCLVVNPDHGQLDEYLSRNTPAGLGVSTVMQTEADGLGHAVLCAEHAVGDSPFIVYLGDALYEDRIKGFVTQFVRDYPRGLLRL
ncbi:glucose-1-phosphate thymidylyltransferase, partial [candidate division WOR-3 bacterium]|nr:glucose-1-phosphate thymidylyltransferase [candidate division WOR-3 bacterium]